ncbi:hypothetical protein PYW07_003148 [Mythimna separata]|uniref:MORN repeat-containing protein 5 n=1 Tax=Mythimna separata TaxID=271217 RepID=A0AAD7YI47_MYTSE|nr:hypothetical protein PYW07_003148 [Mythimna separata]
MDYCQKHFPEKPIIVTKEMYPCKCQGLCLMKEFVKKHKEKCKTVEPDEPSKIKKKFMTGSTYEGDFITSTGCMHGHGVYTFPNGVVYEGEFKDGMMHGQGELRYQTVNGQAIVRGNWTEDILSERKIFFDDETLEHEEHDWKYCKVPDRRFSKEYADGLQPGGKSYRAAFIPPIELPEDYFDTGDGFYERIRQVIYTYNDLRKVVRRPTHHEKNWILGNCRSGAKKMTVGPRRDFYETFVQPMPLLEPEPEPKVKYTRKSPRSPHPKTENEKTKDDKTEDEKTKDKKTKDKKKRSIRRRLPATPPGSGPWPIPGPGELRTSGRMSRRTRKLKKIRQLL